MLYFSCFKVKLAQYYFKNITVKQYSQKQLKSIDENFQQGQKAIQMGMYSRAEKQFLEVLKIAPEIVEAQNALAFIYVVSKQHDKATALLKTVLKAMPNHAQTHHNLANSLHEQKLYDEAISHYQTAIQLDPKFVEAYIHCGISHRMQKNYETAIQYLHQALNLDKANARAFHVLGMIYVDTEDYPRALECLENASGLAPQHAEYRVSFACILEKASLDYEAGIQYHKACETDPNYLDGFTLYGRFLCEHHRYDEALESAKRAAQIDSQNLDIVDQLGDIYLGMGNTTAAIEKFNTALLKQPKRLTSLIGLERTYQETGKLDDAVKLCDEIIAIDGSLPTGYVLKSRIKKSKSGDGLAEDLLKFTINEALDNKTKISLDFALGKIFDDQNNYAEAFKYYAAGNALRNDELNYSAEADEARFSQLIEIFNADFIKEHQYLGVASDMPIVIVGMPRSATTLTEQIISSHPMVQAAGEVIFWGRAKTAMPLRLNTETPFPECVKEMLPEHAKDIASMYESTLTKIVGTSTNGIKHITDKMPHNFLNVGLIALLFPNVKIIHTKRDPMDTCLSIFFQSFNDSHPYAFDLSNLGFHYRQYERIMRHWHEVLPGRILDINYSDTIADPEYWSRQLIAHVGLEWDDACLTPHKLERSVKTASHWQVRQPIYKTSVERWRNYEAFLDPLKQALKGE
jgi:tetratricopeptide (TPR) repeat protein